MQRILSVCLVNSLAGAMMVLAGSDAVAQPVIVPDATLGAGGSELMPWGSVDEIGGGVVRAPNLFHSFSEFGVAEGRSAYFLMPNSSIETIFARVTGGNRSDILGTLGVRGTADLFLLNPHGILFGPNAQLDISGSFVGTTAERVEFGEGLSFSAVNPQAAPLLQINLTPGLQYGAGSLGQIQTQGLLQVGGELRLAAQSGVRVQDSAQQAVRLEAGKDLVIEGGEVAIDTLSHSESLLSAGGDVVLRSPNPIQADAHVRSGGNFRIEQLDGSLNSFWSPEDPIIQAAGDIQFDSYTGASLHLFAGGSVTATGKITITGPDISGNALQETVVLSDGTAVSVDGVNRPVLDIRAGTTARPLSQGGGAGFNNAPTVSGATGSNIQLGRVEVKAPNGLVLLTNQYQPNLTLAAGDIRAQGIFTDQRTGNVGQTTANFVGNGGEVAIDARGSIAIAPRSQINTSALPAAGNGGNITLLAGQAINLSSPHPPGQEGKDDAALFLRVDTTAKFGRAGDITMKAPSVLLDDVELILELDTNGLGRSGNMLIVADQLKADNFTDFYADSKGKGDAGSITLRARDIKLLGGTQLWSRLRENGEGRAGDILVVADTLTIDRHLINTSSTAGLNTSSLGRGNAGNVIVQLTGHMEMKNGSRIDSNGSSQKGEAGTISIAANSLSMINSTMTSRVNSKGGNNGIIINLKEDLLIDAPGRVTAGLFTDARQDARTAPGESAGNITVNARNITVKDGEGRIQAGSIGLTGGGKISLTARDTLTVEYYGWILNGAGPSSSGEAKDIEIYARQINLDSGKITSSTQSSVNGGSIFIDTQAIKLNNQAQINTDTTGTGNAGDIKINSTRQISVLGDSIIYSGSRKNTGNGGNISLRTSQLTLASGGRIETQTEGITFRKLAETMQDKIYFDIVNRDRPIAYWKFDETTGTIAPNSSGANFEGKYVGNIDQSALGISGTSARFGDSYGVVRVDDDFDLKNTSFIVEAWIKPDPNNPPKEQVFFGAHDASQTRTSFHLRLNDNGAVRLGLWGDDLDTPIGVLPFDNQWHHVVAKVIHSRPPGATRQTTRLEIDGLEAAVGTKGPFEGQPPTVVIGSWEHPQYPQPFKGSIDEVAIYKIESFDPENDLRAFERHYVAGLLSQGLSPEEIGEIRPGDAKAGDISIEANIVDISGTSNIPNDRFTFGSASRGISSGLFSGSRQASSGDGGNIVLKSKVLSISDGGALSSRTLSASDGGKIDIQSEQINLSRGGQILTTSEGAGQAGSIVIDAREIEISGFDSQFEQRIRQVRSEQVDVDGPFSGFFAQAKDSGSAGNVLIEAQRMNIQDEGKISTSTSGSGIGGTLRIKVPDQINLSNASLTAQSNGSGKAGGIALSSENINLDHAIITVESNRSGQGGDINVSARNLSLNNSQFSASTTSAEGGDINLDIAQLLLLRDKSSIATNAGESDGGDITINNLNGFLILRDGSRIETNARQGGNGGDIRIDNTNGFIIAVPKESSDITANAVAGNGGKVDVFSQGILGLEFRPKLTSQSDITASSESGAQGNVSLNTPNVDPSNGLAELPTTPISGAERLDRRCAAQTTGKQSNGSFQTSGRGGLPVRPGNPANIPYTTGDIHSFDLDIAQHSSPPHAPSMASAPSSLEAQQIQITPDGRVRLVAGRSVIPPQATCSI